MYTIYSKPGCSFCDQAKQLLETKGLPFVEHTLDSGQEKQSGKSYYTIGELQAKVPGVRTVPQIFKDQELVGGYTQLKKLLTS